METPEDVAVMLRLAELGWGSKRIAAELGCSRTTVKRYLRQGGWASYRDRGRRSALAGLEGWLAERFRRHRGNADVVRQELAREHGVRVSLRTVERAVADLRRDLLAEARACVRFETPPGRQLQIDFGSTFVPIGGEVMRVYLFVATLGYSRRGFVAAFRHERQPAWFEGLEAAFRHFGGVPREVLLDNAKPLVVRHDAVTREVVFNERLHAFARYWGFRPRACAPYRARTKGKDENGVGYVKKNAIAGPRLRLLGRRWKRTLSGGCARLPISASMAPPASRRSSGSGGRRPRRWRRSWAGRRSGRCARWSAACRRTARSISTPITTACPGG